MLSKLTVDQQQQPSRGLQRINSRMSMTSRMSMGSRMGGMPAPSRLGAMRGNNSSNNSSNQLVSQSIDLIVNPNLYSA